MTEKPRSLFQNNRRKSFKPGGASFGFLSVSSTFAITSTLERRVTLETADSIGL